jgi:hypothetical protein
MAVTDMTADAMAMIAITMIATMATGRRLGSAGAGEIRSTGKPISGDSKVVGRVLMEFRNCEFPSIGHRRQAGAGVLGNFETHVA